MLKDFSLWSLCVFFSLYFQLESKLEFRTSEFVCFCVAALLTVAFRCYYLFIELISTNNSQFVYFYGFFKHCRERNEKREDFFSSSFAIDGSLCTHNPIHSFALSGHFTKSEKKKIDCPEKAGYWLDVQYTELCKMATAEMKSLFTFFLFSSQTPILMLSYSGACLFHTFEYFSNTHTHSICLR